MSVSNKTDAATRSWSISDEPGGIISDSKTEASVRTWTAGNEFEGMVSSLEDTDVRFWDENGGGGSIEPKFAKLMVTNTRTSGSAAANKIWFSQTIYNSSNNEIRSKNIAVEGGQTTEIQIPILPAINVKSYVVMTTPSTSKEITFSTESNKIELLTKSTSGSDNYYIFKIKTISEAGIAITIGETS